MISFFKYVDAMWIGELNPCTKLRKNPAYSHDPWNKHKAILNGDHRTNNIVEGNNHRFSLLHPAETSDWSVIDRIKTEESMTKSSLHQVAMGNTGQNHNTSHHLKHQDQEDKHRSIVSNLNIMSLGQFRQYLALS